MQKNNLVGNSGKVDELKRKIESLSDIELIESIRLGVSGFREGVYHLYLEEAERRDINKHQQASDEPQKIILENSQDSVSEHQSATKEAGEYKERFNVVLAIAGMPISIGLGAIFVGLHEVVAISVFVIVYIFFLVKCMPRTFRIDESGMTIMNHGGKIVETLERQHMISFEERHVNPRLEFWFYRMLLLGWVWLIFFRGPYRQFCIEFGEYQTIAIYEHRHRDYEGLVRDLIDRYAKEFEAVRFRVR